MDLMDGRGIPLEVNIYSQVFANMGYFSHVYPIYLNHKAGDALRLFCQELYLPEKITFNSSNDKCMKGTEFMKQVCQHNIDCRIS